MWFSKGFQGKLRNMWMDGWVDSNLNEVSLRGARPFNDETVQGRKCCRRGDRAARDHRNVQIGYLA